MSGTINLALSQQFTADSVPLSGGRLYFFAAGTTTPQSAYQDTALTIVHPNPLSLDASGRIPMFYLDNGNIKVRLRDEERLVIFAAEQPAGHRAERRRRWQQPGRCNDGAGTGDMKIRFGTGTLTGFVIANGTTVGHRIGRRTARRSCRGGALQVPVNDTAVDAHVRRRGDDQDDPAATGPATINDAADLRGPPWPASTTWGAQRPARFTSAHWVLSPRRRPRRPRRLAMQAAASCGHWSLEHRGAHPHRHDRDQSVSHNHTGTTLQNLRA